MQLKTNEKIKLLCDRRSITLSQLAKELGISAQNLSNKLSRNNFSENDLKEIAKALDCEFESFFVLKSGEKL